MLILPPQGDLPTEMSAPGIFSFWSALLCPQCLERSLAHRRRLTNAGRNDCIISSLLPIVHSHQVSLFLPSYVPDSSVLPKPLFSYIMPPLAEGLSGLHLPMAQPLLSDLITVQMVPS